MQRLIIPAKNFRSPRPSPVRLLVVHLAQCDMASAISTANWQAGGGGPDQVSSHLVIGPDIVITCVADDDVAFTQGPPWNNISWSGEMSGWNYYTTEWMSPQGLAQRELVAQEYAYRCVKWGIPAIHLSVDQIANGESGICTHVDLTAVDQKYPGRFGKNTHTDPGTNYPLDLLIARIHDIVNPPAPPKEEQDMPDQIIRIQGDTAQWLYSRPWLSHFRSGAQVDASVKEDGTDPTIVTKSPNWMDAHLGFVVRKCNDPSSRYYTPTAM